MTKWGFLTNHAHVLIQIARDPRSTVREIAIATGITERAVHSVLKDLRQAGVIDAQRDGRRNVYRLDPIALMKHRPWGGSDMEIPPTLIDATLRGLSQFAVAEGSPHDEPSRKSA